MWYRQRKAQQAQIKTNGGGVGGGVLSAPPAPAKTQAPLPAPAKTQAPLPAPAKTQAPLPAAGKTQAAAWDQAVAQPTIDTKKKSLDPKDVNNAYLGGDANTPIMEGYQARYKSPVHTNPDQTTWEEQLETARHENMGNPKSPLGGDGNPQSMASTEEPDEQFVRGPFQEKSGKGSGVFQGSGASGDSVVDNPSTKTFV